VIPTSGQQPPMAAPTPTSSRSPVLWIVVATLALIGLLSVWSLTDSHLDIPVISRLTCSAKGGVWYGGDSWGNAAGCYDRDAFRPTREPRQQPEAVNVAPSEPPPTTATTVDPAVVAQQQAADQAEQERQAAIDACWAANDAAWAAWEDAYNAWTEAYNPDDPATYDYDAWLAEHPQPPEPNCGE
jgi:hypothetical protein